MSELATSLMRDYENQLLPLEKRVPSLARRFPSLRHAPGLEPFSPSAFHAWTTQQGRDTCAWHAGHLILNLTGTGEWEAFDAVAAVQAFDENHRIIFSNWIRCW